MDWKDWLKIIGFILTVIAGGASKSEAVSMAAAKFDISEAEIWNHGGF